MKIAIIILWISLLSKSILFVQVWIGKRKNYNKKMPSFRKANFDCYVFRDNYALSTLPERRQWVQTYTSSTPPVGVLTLTFWTLGAQLRLVFLLLWLTAFPLILPFPHTLQTLDITVPPNLNDWYCIKYVWILQPICTKFTF